MLPCPTNIADSVLVTHKGCLDGAGCAVLFVNAGGLRENVRFIGAGLVEKFVKTDPLFQSDKFLLFADVGLNDKSSTYADMMEKRGNLVMIDHHKTSIHIKDRDWANIDMDGCGTVLLRNYLISLPVPEGCFSETRFLKSSSYRRMAETIDDFDRWIRKNPHSEEMADFMTFVGQDSFVERFMDVKSRFGNPKGIWTEFERDVLGVITKRRDEAIEQALKRTIVQETDLPDGSRVTVGYIVSGEPFISIMLDRMLARLPNIKVAAQINVDRGSVSLRSRGDYDVARMASLYGGGGHAAASGHRVPDDLLATIVSEIH